MKTRLLASLAARSAVDRGAGFWNVLGLIGFLVAGTLYVAASPELLPFSVAPIYLLAADYPGPGPGINNQFKKVTTHPDASIANDEEAVQLFGLGTEPVAEGPLSDKWRRVEAGITSDLEVIAQCQASKPCPAAAQKLIDLSREGTGRNERARVGVINRAVNFAIRPVSDERQWGISDRWSYPLETLSSNAGDCEDYAIVKYAALLTAGVPKDALKIVVWRQRLPNEDHAVVAVRVDSQWLILDNRTLTLVRDTDATRVTPEFALDHHGVRRFVRNGWNFKAAKAVALRAI